MRQEIKQECQSIADTCVCLTDSSSTCQDGCLQLCAAIDSSQHMFAILSLHKPYMQCEGALQLCSLDRSCQRRFPNYFYFYEHHRRSSFACEANVIWQGQSFSEEAPTCSQLLAASDMTLYAFSTRLALNPFCFSAMAFVGPVQWPQGYRPVGVYCEVCDTNLLTWRCYNCGGLYCGQCLFQHRLVPGYTQADVEADGGFANEVAEGMHCLYYRYWLRLSSEMALDPAEAAFLYSRPYICR